MMSQQDPVAARSPAPQEGSHELPGAVIGLDVGSKRIGVAVSDEIGLLARPHGMIRRQSYNKDAASIAALVDETRASRIVIGLPLGLAGGFTDQTLKVQRFGQMLGARVPIPVEWWDERLTTVMAQAIHNPRSSRARSTRHPKTPQRALRDSRPQPGRLDELAAAVILQAYLDSRAGRGGSSA